MLIDGLDHRSRVGAIKVIAARTGKHVQAFNSSKSPEPAESTLSELSEESALRSLQSDRFHHPTHIHISFPKCEIALSANPTLTCHFFSLGLLKDLRLRTYLSRILRELNAARKKSLPLPAIFPRPTVLTTESMVVWEAGLKLGAPK